MAVPPQHPESHCNSTTTLSPESAHQRLAALRAQAQQAFHSAELDRATEQTEQSVRKAQAQKYAKIASLPRRKADNNTVTPNRSRPSGKSESFLVSQDRAETAELVGGAKLRPFQDVLHRLRWDGSHDLSRYIVGYLERFEGVREMPLEDFVRVNDDYTDEDWIPLHRVRYVKFWPVDGEDEVVWDRDRRIDNIFGSGRSASEVETPGMNAAKSTGGVTIE